MLKTTATAARAVVVLAALVAALLGAAFLPGSAWAAQVGSITVRLTASNPFNDTPGLPVAGVGITLTRGDEVVGAALSDAHGEASFTNLPEALYRVTVSGEDSSGALDVSVPSTDPATGDEVYDVVVYPKRHVHLDTTTSATPTSAPDEEGDITWPLFPLIKDDDPAPGRAPAAATDGNPPQPPGVADVPNTADAPRGTARGIVGRLPMTGADVVAFLVIGGAAVALGIALLLRRRRAEEEGDANDGAPEAHEAHEAHDNQEGKE